VRLRRIVLADDDWASTLTDADRRGLTPLFWAHVASCLDTSCDLDGCEESLIEARRAKHVGDQAPVRLLWDGLIGSAALADRMGRVHEPV
jgi:hypothetical protein